MIPFILSFSGDYEGKNVKAEHEESSVSHITPKQGEINAFNIADEEINIGSSTSFKDHDGGDSVELHNYEKEDVDQIHRKLLPWIFRKIFGLISSSRYFRLDSDR